MSDVPAPPREERWSALAEGELDVLVVGGGITGAGVAHDLALRGARVALVERGDWAGATSSASSRLVHGGLRYLEQLAFGLVRESCLERARLLDNAAGLVWPERFVFPVRRGDRVGRAKLAAGLALYTLVSLPRPLGLPRLLSAAAVARALPGIDADGLVGAGSYLDGATDDARLALAVVRSAHAAGAVTLSRVEALGVERGPGGAEARLRDVLTGRELARRARAVVLCGGPFTDELRGRAGLPGRWIAPTRGAHVLLRRERLPTDGCALFTSAVDGRAMFLLAWPRFTAVGTTDLDHDPAAEVRATRAEVRYLLDSANALVPGAALVEDDVVTTWAGLRPLLAAPEDDPSARSREERVERDGPLWTIAGGKLTGYRAMAEHLCAALCRELGIGRATRASPTRGARLVGALPARVARPAWSRWPAPPADPREVAWSRRYAALAPAVAERCAREPEGLEPLDAETARGELAWAVEHEDCLAPQDFLLRRTDLGYAPRERADALVATVAAELAARLGWDDATRRRAEASCRADLARGHAWREDPG